MSHTIFSASPFRGGYSHAVVPFRLGGGRVDGVLDFLGLDEDDAEGLLKPLDEAIAAVPVGALKSDFEKRRDGCMAEKIISKYKCLYDLFQDVKSAIKDGDQAPPTGGTPTGGAKTTPPSEFPWVPVGIAAGVGVAALLYFAFKKKSA